MNVKMTKELSNTLQGRYLSLDVMRGLTIALMIVVNTPGSWSDLYAPLAHAAWHGFTPTDLVFPSFLFIVGSAMSFSFKKFFNTSTSFFYKKVIRRTLLIFIIGYLLNAFPFYDITEEGSMILKDFTQVRLMGVLQRIALCYFLASVIVFHFRKSGAVWMSIILLFLYWVIMYFFGDKGDPYEMLTNASHKLDVWLLGSDLLYKGEGVPFDPEGVLSTLPSTVNVLIGYLCGLYIQIMKNKKETVYRLAIAGAVFILLALAWDMLFPINKKIWTSSFVMLTCGLDLLIIAILMIVIEVYRIKGWTYFFEVFGRNPLVLYILSLILIRIFYLVKMDGVTLKSLLYEDVFMSWLSPKNASLLFALMYMMLIWLVGLWMDKKGKYVKV